MSEVVTETNAASLSIGLPNFGDYLPLSEWHRITEIARAADEAGVGRLVVVDHVTMGNDTSGYQWGRFPTGPDAPWLEPLTVLASIAAVTERVRLATGVLLAGLRGPTVLAKTAATLDVMSQGRLELGVATGWQVAEYEAAGLEWTRRGRLLDDVLDTCRTLWAGDDPDVHCEPRPVQAGGVPWWIAGPLHRRNLHRLVRHGAGWIPIMGAGIDDVRTGVAAIRQEFEGSDRQWTGLSVQGSLPVVRNASGAPDLDATIDQSSDWIEAGATAIHLPMKAFCPDWRDAAEFFNSAVARFEAR